MSDKKTNAVLNLVVNFFIPGLGTYLWDNKKTGKLQLLIWIIGVILTVTIIGSILGVPLTLVAWIWALVTGIQLLMKS